MLLYDLNLMYTKVVELEELYLLNKDHLKIYWSGFRKIFNIQIYVVQCIAYVECILFKIMLYDVTWKERHIKLCT